MNRKRVVAIAAPVCGALLGALILLPLVDREISPVTSGVIIGIAGVICLTGVGFGIWDARRTEGKRKAKEEIWMKH